MMLFCVMHPTIWQGPSTERFRQARVCHRKNHKKQYSVCLHDQPPQQPACIRVLKSRHDMSKYACCKKRICAVPTTKMLLLFQEFPFVLLLLSFFRQDIPFARRETKQVKHQPLTIGCYFPVKILYRYYYALPILFMLLLHRLHGKGMRR